MRIAVLEDSLIQQKRIRNLLDLNHRLFSFAQLKNIWNPISILIYCC